MARSRSARPVAAGPAQDAPAQGVPAQDAQSRGAPAATGPAGGGGDRHPGPPGRAATQRRGSPLPYLLVLMGFLGGLGWVLWGGAHGVRGGSLTLAGAACAAALARLVLPEGRAGLLASRKRFTDVVTLAALAAGLLATSLLLPT